jgi:hypothetical protein
LHATGRNVYPGNNLEVLAFELVKCLQARVKLVALDLSPEIPNWFEGLVGQDFVNAVEYKFGTTRSGSL